MPPYDRLDRGEPVQGTLHSTDASGGVEITLYDDDGATRAVGSTEQLAIDHFAVVVAPGGDTRLFMDTDDDNAADAGEEFFRGTVAANGGVVLDLERNPFIGALGAKPHIIAPAGTVDVTLRGRILTPQTKTSAEKPHYVG